MKGLVRVRVLDNIQFIEQRTQYMLTTLYVLDAF